MRKSDAWSSARLSFEIPREAAIQLQQLAASSDVVLRELGILTVQLENEPLATISYPQSKRTNGSVKRALNGHVERVQPPGHQTASTHPFLQNQKAGSQSQVANVTKTAVLGGENSAKHKLEATAGQLTQKKPRRVRKPKDSVTSKSNVIPMETTGCSSATITSTLLNSQTIPSTTCANRLSSSEPSLHVNTSTSGHCTMIINPYTGQLEPDPTATPNSIPGQGLQVLKGLTPSELKPGTGTPTTEKTRSLDNCSGDMLKGLESPGKSAKNGFVHKKSSGSVDDVHFRRDSLSSKHTPAGFSRQLSGTNSLSNGTDGDETLVQKKPTELAKVTIPRTDSIDRTSTSTIIKCTETDSVTVLSPANLTQMMIKCSQYTSIDISQAKKQRLLELSAGRIGAGSPVTEEDGISPSLPTVSDSCGSADSDSADIPHAAVLSSPSSSADDASHFSSPRTDPLLGDSSSSVRTNPVNTMQSPDHGDFGDMPTEKGAGRFLPSLHDNVVKRQMVSVKPVSPVAKYSMEC